jgi:AraC-like DNA-binding protein
MSVSASPNPFVRLSIAKARLADQLRASLPAGWPDDLDHFRAEVELLPDVPPAAVLLALTDVARELEELAGSRCARRLTAALRAADAAGLPTHMLCCRFGEALRAWFDDLGAGTLVPAVQARRMAGYIRQHSAEPITLATLAGVSGWDARVLARLFLAEMGVSVGEYVRKVRIDEAAARLRRGDKVESVIAAVGWKGRRHFFRHFKTQMGVAPAKYREAWRLRGSRSRIVAACSPARRTQHTASAW